MALVKYNNNSLSSVTSAPNFPAGAITLIKTLTASSSSTLSFVDGSSDVVLDSTYPIYMFKFINMHPATDGTDFQFNGSADTGSNYNVTKHTAVFRANANEGDSAANLSYDTGRDLQQSTSFQNILSIIGNGDDECASGELFLFNPSSTTFVKFFMGRGNIYLDSNYTRDEYLGGYFNTTSAIDAIQFKMASGNIDAGTVKLYGIKDS